MVAKRLTAKQAALLRAVARMSDKALLEFVEYDAGCGFFESVEDIPQADVDRILTALRRR